MISTATSGDDPDETLARDVEDVAAVDVDPGQVVVVTARLGDLPRVVFASADPGGAVRRDRLGDPDGRVRALGGGEYRALVDTRGMVAGEGWWYLFGEDPDRPEAQRAKLGRFRVRGEGAPRGLFDVDGADRSRARGAHDELGGLHMLGAFRGEESASTEGANRLRWWVVGLAALVGVAVGAAAMRRA